MQNTERNDRLLSFPVSQIENRTGKPTAGNRGQVGDLAYALGGWSGRKDRGTGKLADEAKERWKPNMKVLKAANQYSAIPAFIDTFEQSFEIFCTIDP
jgi:hypothetical protein